MTLKMRPPATLPIANAGQLGEAWPSENVPMTTEKMTVMTRPEV